MSLIFFDGFDGYNSGPDLVAHGKWYTNINVDSSTFTRNGVGRSIYFNNGASGSANYLPFSADKYNTAMYIGLAISIAQSQPLQEYAIGFLNSGGVEQCFIGFVPVTATEYKLRAMRGATTLWTSNVTLNAGSWYYIELKVLIHDTNGILDLVVNDVADSSFSGNTRNTASSTFYFVDFRSTGTTSGVGWYMDDVYVCDSSGTFNNTYLGEVICSQAPLTGDSSVAWSRNTGASNYLAVDDLLGSPDDATTYVFSLTPTDRDEYTLTNTSGADTVFGVKVNVRAQKDGANARSLKYGIKTGVNQRETQVILGAGYSNFQTIHETYDGTNQWTTATLDAAVATIEVV